MSIVFTPEDVRLSGRPSAGGRCRNRSAEGEGRNRATDETRMEHGFEKEMRAGEFGGRRGQVTEPWARAMLWEEKWSIDAGGEVGRGEGVAERLSRATISTVVRSVLRLKTLPCFALLASKQWHTVFGDGA